jgi:hypothetical protein
MRGELLVDRTIRIDALGSVARPFTVEEIRETLGPICIAVRARRVADISLLMPVLNALRHGRSPRRGEVAARQVGQIVNAFVELVVMDGRSAESRTRAHDRLRALENPAVDALEDLLGNFAQLGPIFEAERMHRAGLLVDDWRIVYAPHEKVPAGFFAVHVVAKLRLSSASA